MEELIYVFFISAKRIKLPYLMNQIIAKYQEIGLYYYDLEFENIDHLWYNNHLVFHF